MLTFTNVATSSPGVKQCSPTNAPNFLTSHYLQEIQIDLDMPWRYCMLGSRLQ